MIRLSKQDLFGSKCQLFVPKSTGYEKCGLGAKTFLNTEALLQIVTGATGGTFSSVLLKHAGGAGAADHSLAIKLENTVIATFTPTGFGHGIAVPQTNVHIQESNTSTLPAVEIEQLSTGDAALQFSISGDAYVIGIDNSDSDKFKISYATVAGAAVLGGIDRLIIDSVGQVGIGTTPSVDVHVKAGDTSTEPMVEIEQAWTGDAGLMFSISGDCYAIGIDNSDSDKFKISYAAAAGTAVLGTNDRLIIDSVGQVGIRTTPSVDLHVKVGDTSTEPMVEIEQTSTGDAGLMFSVVGDCYAIGIDNSDSDLFKISYSSTAGGAVLGTNDRLSIFSDGGVTIGGPTGGSKGSGTLNAQAVYDDNVLLTDFVFKPGYKYLTIREMEAFFRREHHLPTIPGEKRWKKSGAYSTGELGTRLWETVEVQALYICELEERLSEVEAMLEI